MGETHARATIQGEIIALHAFFVTWFSGTCEASDRVFKREFRDRFEANFLLIPPAGCVLSIHELAESIRSRHGSNPDFRIAIRNVVVRRSWPGHILATYEEWQRNAAASTPQDNARVATVLFETRQRLSWLHVHETWLPASIMTAGPYDF